MTRRSMRGSVLLLESVKRHGVRYACGIVGGEASAICFSDVDGIEFILTRHETTAGIMADAYARITQRPQMAFSTFGPGMTNLATGVASAQLDRSPMIAVSAQVARADLIHNHTHQCLDNVAIMRPMSKFAREFESVEEIPDVVAEAARAARADLPGPSFLSFPLDLMSKEIPDRDAERRLDGMASSDPEPIAPASNEDLVWLAERIASAKHPLAVVGNVVIRNELCKELRELVEHYRLPVISTLASKGVLPDSHPLSFGAVNKYIDGIFGARLVEEIFAPCDLVVLIGFDYSEDLKPALWRRGVEKQTVMLGPSANRISRVFTPDREITGDLGSALRRMVEIGPRSERNVDAFTEIRQPAMRLHLRPDANGTVPPENIVRIVSKTLGPDGILASDIGLHKQYAGLLSTSEQPNTFLCSNGLGSFGTGLGLALGAKLARPDSRVVAIVGDGGFHSNSQDMETAVRYSLPVVVVVFKDNSYGLIKHYQLMKGEIVRNEVDFGEVDFVGLAKANGWQAERISSSSMLEDRLEAAFTSKKPTLLEVPVIYQARF